MIAAIMPTVMPFCRPGKIKIELSVPTESTANRLPTTLHTLAEEMFKKFGIN